LKLGSALLFAHENSKSTVLENDFNLLAIMGIDDEIRSDIKEAISECKEGGVTLRLITSENIWTARAIALELGIISK
jgi:Ca2+-transporting ATPase